MYNVFQTSSIQELQMLTPTMTIDQFVAAVKNTDTIFGVTFIKKTDGSIRNMQARMHVRKGVKGVLAPGQRKAEDAANNVLTVYDMQVVEKTGSTKGAFRRINLEQLKSCRLMGASFNWNNDTALLVQEG
jgi:hypothetical protein